MATTQFPMGEVALARLLCTARLNLAGSPFFSHRSRPSRCAYLTRVGVRRHSSGERRAVAALVEAIKSQGKERQ